MSLTPFQLDTHALQLPRRPGSMVRVERTVPAPPDCEIALARVTDDVTLSLMLESVMEGVWVSGTAEANVKGECARCLDPISWPMSVALEELFAYPASDARGHVIEGDQDDDGDQLFLENDICDVESLIRDAIVPDLPLAPLCSPTCAGLCSQCGQRLEDDPSHSHEILDPRWAALDALRDREQ
jgi:uncharacterized protein